MALLYYYFVYIIIKLASSIMEWYSFDFLLSYLQVLLLLSKYKINSFSPFNMFPIFEIICICHLSQMHLL